MSARVPALPPTAGAWVVLVLGALLLLLALALQWQMWEVELGFRSVSPGGGEYFLGELVGLPALLVAVALLGGGALKQSWRSWLGWAGFGAALVPLIGWIVLVAK